MGKRRRECFEDAFGNWVIEGDWVYYHGVNEGLEGVVTKQNDDPSMKAFTVMDRNNKLFYMNREFCKKEMNFQTWAKKRGEYIDPASVKQFLSMSKHETAAQVLKEIESAEEDLIKVIPTAVWDDEYYNFEI